MRLKQEIIRLTAILIVANTAVFAKNESAHEQVQVPQCLAAKIRVSHQVLAENKQFKIIDLLSSDINNLTQLADQVQCGRFVNVSHRLSGTAWVDKQHGAQILLQNSMLRSPRSTQFNRDSYEIKHQEEVKAALKKVVAANIWDTLTHLTYFYDRSARTDSGVHTAYWLKDIFEDMAYEYGRNDTATFFVETGQYKQPSLVTVIGKGLDEDAVVLGAHMDTLDSLDDHIAGSHPMPGAGDDGSGSASLMEMTRILLSSKTTFKRPIYIIWYAAEERGLVGSQHVVQHFKTEKIRVKAAIQFDMTGYRVNPDDPTMWVFTDYTDEVLSDFITRLIKTYIHVPVAYSQCGYGCSDHVSWTKEGIPTAFPCESNFKNHNPNIHTSLDTMDHLSLEHMTNFSKLALAFAIELASG